MSERRPPWALLALALGGAALLVVLLVFGALQTSVPPGWTSCMGYERDVRPLFERVWLWRAFHFDIPAGAAAPAYFTAGARAALCGLWLIYMVTSFAMLRLPQAARRAGLYAVAVVTVLAHALLVSMPPVQSGDLFHYALFGRMVSHYGFNPYVVAAKHLAADPIWPYASWNYLTTHYGPGFTWLSAGLTALSGGDVFWTAIAFKATAALMSLASAWLIRDISARLGEGDGSTAFALYALNPLILYETAGIGHNEAVVVFYATAGVALALRGKPWAALVVLLLSADVKNITAALALFFAVHFIFQAEGGRARIRRAAGVAAVGLAVTLALWLPFWQGLHTLSTSRDLIAQAPSLMKKGPAAPVGAFRLVTFAAIVVGCAFAAARTSMSGVLNLSAAVVLVFVIWIFPWTMAWYAIPPLALAIAARRSRINSFLIALALVYGLLFMILYTVLQPA